MISSKGLEHSVELAVKKRLGLIRGAMFETNAIMEDYRLQATNVSINNIMVLTISIIL